MKKTSWEIIAAGLILLFVAIFITSKTDKNQHFYSEGEETPQQRAVAIANNDRAEKQSVRVISVEGLRELEELKELETLETLEGLEKLKGLATLIPEKEREEIVTEVNKALSELKNEEFSLNLNLAKGLVLLKKNYPINQGEWSETSSGVYTYTKELDVSGLHDLAITLGTGSLTLVGSENTQGSLTIKASGVINPQDSLEEMVSVNYNFSDGDGKVEIGNNQVNSDQNIHLHTTMVLPSNIELTSFINGGHIEATNFAGDQEFKTMGGHITLKKLSGDVTAYTEGGHIKIEDCRGDISLKSLGGHLSAINCAGDIEMRTSGGNIKAAKIAGAINAFTSGGNIKLQFNSIKDDIQARNGAGQVDILLPANTHASLTANGSKIDIDEAFNFTGERKKTQAIGKLGNGGDLDIIVKTGYGTVTIKKND